MPRWLYHTTTLDIVGIRLQDRVGGSLATPQHQLNIAEHSRVNRKGLAPDDIVLAIGMSVLVTVNIQTDADLVNGSRGEIVDIILDPDEPLIDKDTKVVKLTRPLSYVLVKFEHTRLQTLPGLPPKVVPIAPAKRTLSYKPAGSLTAITASRWQLPITGAYTFTDYQSQGEPGADDQECICRHHVTS